MSISDVVVTEGSGSSAVFSISDGSGSSDVFSISDGSGSSDVISISDDGSADVYRSIHETHMEGVLTIDNILQGTVC